MLSLPVHWQQLGAAASLGLFLICPHCLLPALGNDAQQHTEGMLHLCWPGLEQGLLAGLQATCVSTSGLPNASLKSPNVCLRSCRHSKSFAATAACLMRSLLLPRPRCVLLQRRRPWRSSWRCCCILRWTTMRGA